MATGTFPYTETIQSEIFFPCVVNVIWNTIPLRLEFIDTHEHEGEKLPYLHLYILIFVQRLIDSDYYLIMVRLKTRKQNLSV